VGGVSVGTNVRVGRATRGILALQAAKGTAVSALGGASAINVRTPELALDPSPDWSDPVWMSRLGAGAAAGERVMPREKAARIAARPTPATLEWFFRSHWGAFAAGAFTRATQVNEWATLALVENRFSSTAEKLIRFYDGWIHRVTLSILSGGRASLFGEFCAEADDVRALNALAGVTLPAANMEPADQNEFAGRSAVLRCAPSGANAVVPFERLSILFDGGLVTRWSQANQLVRVYSSGHRRVALQLRGRVHDQAWEMLTNARAGTAESYRLTMTAPSPAKTFTVTLHSVRWTVEALEQRGTEYGPFVASGQAMVSAGGSFVDLTLS
jgi:hypothetical protein